MSGRRFDWGEGADGLPHRLGVGRRERDHAAARRVVHALVAEDEADELRLANVRVRL